MSQVREQVRELLLADYLEGENPDDLKDDTALITGGILDSLSTLRFISQLESTFGISLDARDAEYENLDSIDAVTALVESKLR